MPFFSGFAQGASDALTEMRLEKQRQDEANMQRENAALMHLTTMGNPEIAAAATTALLSPKRPAKGFMGSLFGGVQGNPALPTIRDLIAKGRPSPTEPGPSQLPEGSSGALPAGSPTEPGGPPMSMAAVHNALPQAEAGGQTMYDSSKSAFPSAAELAGQSEFAITKNKMAGTMAGLDASGTVDPGMRQIIAMHNAGVPENTTIDSQGNRHFFMGNKEVGAPVAGAGKASGPELQIQSEADNLMAGDPTLTREDAVQRARVSTEKALSVKRTVAAMGPALAQARLTTAQQGVQTAESRMEMFRALTTKTWQQVNGTVPMDREQALTTARQVLGNDPSVTGADVGKLADSLFASTQPGGRGGGAVATPPPAAAAPVTAPAVPRGAAAAPPPAAGTATTPPPGRLEGAITKGGAANVAHNFKGYSEAGKQTMMAIGTVESILPKIIATVKQISPEESNNPIPEKIANELYSLGISPGADMEALLQNAGMAKGYGLRGLLGGRGNQILQGIYGQHLIDPGDSPKLILQKAQTLQANLPGIKAAVDKAENMRVGAKGGANQGGPPGPAVDTAAQVPDLTGLAQGHRRTFTTGPFAGTSWTVGPDGKPQKQ